MARLVEDSKSPGLIRLSGRITNYRCVREEASFVLASTDQTTMGIIAVASALAGLSGQAIATGSNSSSLDEEADHIKFMIDGLQVEGWLWRSPFKEGDFVDVAAEWQGDHYEVFGVARRIDRTVALYPHCSRGRAAHAKNAVFWWVWLGLLLPYFMHSGLLFYIMGTSMFKEPAYYLSLAGSAVFFGLMFTSLAWKWRPFVKMAEKVFKTLEWSNPSRVDLVKSSKAQRVEKDPGEFGTFYFRY